MTRTTAPTRVSTRTHAPILLSAARHYAEASARYQRSRHTARPSHLARARYLEVTASFDKILTRLVLRTGHRGRTLQTATEAALIKAAARRLADQLTETHIGPTFSPQVAYDQLTHLVYDTLAAREAEDAADTAAHARRQQLTTATTRPRTAAQQALAA